jgi:DNA invertase Pin-like site-specific DNA recombinase
VSDVGLGRAGIVMGLEVSRLARNNADWHRLLEIRALADTLILDEDGVYDPASFNDRLLLDLKGTMSEAELHVIKARLRGGILNKVRRGEYRCVLPTGLIYNDVATSFSTRTPKSARPLLTSSKPSRALDPLARRSRRSAEKGCTSPRGPTTAKSSSSL